MVRLLIGKIMKISYLEEYELAISPTIDTLYALGTDVHSGIPNLYLIDISL